MTPPRTLPLAIIDQWKAQGIGVPEALAVGDRLILPIERAEDLDPLAIDFEMPPVPELYLASVLDSEVTDAAVLGRDFLSDRFDVVSFDSEYSGALSVTSRGIAAFARDVYRLHQCCQALLAHVRGYREAEWDAKCARLKEEGRQRYEQDQRAAFGAKIAEQILGVKVGQ